MNKNQKYVELFTALIKHIDSENQNSEFSKSLMNSIQYPNEKHQYDLNNEIGAILKDIKRTRHFLKNIDKQDWIEGFKYYEKIKIPELKIELVKDYKEMKIAEKQNDVLEFGRYLSLQLENALNTVIELLGGHELVKNNPMKYKNKFHDLELGDYSFFNFNKKTGEIENKKLKSISLHSKVFFAQAHYNIKIFWIPIRDIATIRNSASHRGLNDANASKTIKNAKENFTLKKSEYFKEFDKIIKALSILYK